MDLDNMDVETPETSRKDAIAEPPGGDSEVRSTFSMNIQDFDKMAMSSSTLD